MSANEGDSRDWPGFSEEVRVGAANISAAFPDRDNVKNNNVAGRWAAGWDAAGPAQVLDLHERGV